MRVVIYAQNPLNRTVRSRVAGLLSPESRSAHRREPDSAARRSTRTSSHGLTSVIGERG
jgi:hypothetical protein